MEGWRGVIEETPPRRLALSHDSAVTSCTSLAGWRGLQGFKGQGHGPRRRQTAVDAVAIRNTDLGARTRHAVMVCRNSIVTQSAASRSLQPDDVAHYAWLSANCTSRKARALRQ
jgi:hypothetical protein